MHPLEEFVKLFTSRIHNRLIKRQNVQSKGVRLRSMIVVAL